MNTNRKSFAIFRIYAGRHKKSILILTFVYAGSAALLVLAPQTLSRFIDIVHGGGLWHASALAILLYLGAMLAQSAMSALLEYRLSSIGLHFTDDYRRDLMSHYLSLDSVRLAGLTSGEMLTRLNDDVQGLFKYYYILIYKLTGSAVILVCILAALFLQVNWLSAVFLLVSLLSVLGFKIIQDRGIPKYVRRAKASALFNSLLKEILDNSPSLRSLSAEKYAGARMHAEMKNRYRESFPANLMYANLWSASTIVEALIIGTGLFLCLLLHDRGSVSIGAVYLIYTYSSLVIAPLQDFRNHMGNMQGSKAGIIRTQEFLNLPLAVQGGSLRLSSGAAEHTKAIDLVIDDLRFSYGENVPVLNGVNLAIPAGGHVGIMGETGCGKSTLLGLIARLNGFEKGSIFLDGHDLRNIDPADFRRRVAYCTQKTQLIHGSIRDNITFYDDAYSDAKILEAAGMLGLNDWLENLRDGLDTRLEMGEGNLSSGEAQLLALVRLTLRQPGLVLLDEISSSMDAVTERRITAAVKKMCEGRTVIAVAHRKESLDWMDAVMYMEYGLLRQPGNGGKHAR